VEKLRKMGIQTKKKLPSSFARFEEEQDTQLEQEFTLESEP